MPSLNLAKVTALLQELASAAQKAQFSDENIQQLVRVFQGSTVMDLADAVLSAEERQVLRNDLQDQTKMQSRLEGIQKLITEKLSPDIMQQVLRQNWERLVEVLAGQLCLNRDEVVIAEINATRDRIKLAPITD